LVTISDVPIDIDNLENTKIITTTKNPCRSKQERKSTYKACSLDYDENKVNIAFYLSEFNAYYIEDIGDPVTFQNVLDHPLKDQWFESMCVKTFGRQLVMLRTFKEICMYLTNKLSLHLTKGVVRYLLLLLVASDVM
jgi:hypothetical protein